MIRTLVVVLGLAVVTAGCMGSTQKPPVRIGSSQPTATSNAGNLALTDSQSGKASWYGEKFQGRPTASGEPFDMNQMTAAHKTHRFGTRLRVTNIETGKSIVVRVNDRMPDTAGNKGRVIDLSKAAFEQLAPLDRGILDVQLDVVR